MKRCRASRGAEVKAAETAALQGEVKTGQRYGNEKSAGGAEEMGGHSDRRSRGKILKIQSGSVIQLLFSSDALPRKGNSPFANPLKTMLSPRPNLFSSPLNLIWLRFVALFWNTCVNGGGIAAVAGGGEIK